MRTLPLLLRLADDMKRIAFSSTPFYDDPWRLYRMVSQPWPELRHLDRQLEEAIPKIGKDGYQVNVDVTDYKPNELKIKVVDGSVVVEGKHEEGDDSGYVSRQFVRRYQLPKGYDPAKVLSTLSSDGVLTISAPKPHQLEHKSNERLIQIQQTGPAALNIKENPPEETQSSSSSDDSAKK